MKGALLFAIGIFLIGASSYAANPHKVIVGSKSFTEGYILGEIVAQTLEAAASANGSKKVTIERRLGMGGTGILYQALESGDIDLYAEYTGTIADTVLKDRSFKSFAEIQLALKSRGMVMSPPLGFNNTYAIAVRREFAERHRLTKISDLSRVAADARVGFSYEFTTRNDGMIGLTRVYDLKFGPKVRTMEHTLAYEAIRANALDVIDIYSTDAKIDQLNLTLLKDDQGLFPGYQAVVLARSDFVATHPDLWAEIQLLFDRIHEPEMRALNAQVDRDGKSFEAAASSFLGKTIQSEDRSASLRAQLGARTREHLLLVGIALLFSIFVGVPLGIIATQNRYLGQTILLFSGLVQTIPSLALLCFLIPMFGIGMGSALVALCLYGLLPVVTNTYIGLRSIDPVLIETSSALGLGQWESLIRIRIPLASRAILSGIRTSAIVGIGTATLAALIGAGGYGATILSGLATNDMHVIFLGAAPAAVMALAAHGVFEIVERALVPKGLR